MGYLHIDNLYKPEAQRILAFKRIYALEKIHGTSAHVSWDGTAVRFFSGGAKYESFIALFDTGALFDRFTERLGLTKAIIYGEAYGGKEQGMSATYGPKMRFVAFDVQIDGMWLSVPQAADFVASMGLEYVDYTEIESSLDAIDAERDRPSTQAIRNGITEARLREGIVLRPPFECAANNGNRIIAKHKRDEFRETASPRALDPEKVQTLTEASKIASEWVTARRLEHVIDQLIRDRDNKRAEMSDIPALIKLMHADVLREAAGEIFESKDLSKAIGAKTVELLKRHLNERLKEAAI